MNRKILMFVCLTAVLLLSVFPATAQQIQGVTIADIIASAARGPEPQFTMLSAMILKADPSVMAALDNPNNLITFFAPTDEAFKQLRETRYGAASFNIVTRDQDTVTQMMLYHAVPGSYETADLKSLTADGGPKGLDLLTLQGQFLHFTAGSGEEEYLIDGEAKPLLEGVAVTVAGEGHSVTAASPDIQAANGTIHVIDNVLVPTLDSVVQVLSDNHFGPGHSFNTFLSAVAIADPSISNQLLNPNSEITVLVPTDDAFEALETPVATMLSNLQATSDLVAYHILPGRFSSYEILSRIASSSEKTAVINTSLGGMFSRTAVTFSLNADNELVANGNARLIMQDVDAGRSIIHVIDAVVQPPTE